MIWGNRQQLVSGSIVCTIFALITYIEATSQETVDVPLYNSQRMSGYNVNPIEEDKRLNRNLKFGRRAAFKHLKFGKRDESVPSDVYNESDDPFNDADDIDTSSNEINKRYYTDMLDNLYLEDLLQSLNVDRWRKRGKITFGKRGDEMEAEKKAAMRLKFGKRNDMEEGLLEGESGEKRAKMTFGKRPA